MMPTIRAVLSNLLPAEDANSIDIIANDVKYTDAEGKGTEWEIVYRHPESGFGHDKSKAILPYRDLENVPTLFFCGDGVSGECSEANGDQFQ
jgi:2-hydroxy-3-keto-5-methylthiopentenyl-1-phosphate phosphatase